MPRQPKVWERAGRGFWTTIDGKQTFLSRDRKEAERLLHRHLAGMGRVAPEDLPLADLVDLYLDSAGVKPRSLVTYRGFLRSFADSCKLKVSEVRPLHVTRWVKGKDWTQATQHDAIGVVKRLFRWGVAQGYFPEHPVTRMKRPPMTRREPIDPSVLQAIIDHAPPDLKAILTVLRESGARPSELTSARIEHLHGPAIVLKEHKTRAQTGRDRIIYLSPLALEIVRQEIGDRTTGPIFLNRRIHGPWTRGTVWKRTVRLCERRKLTRGQIYGVRHLFASNAINRGDANPALVARLLGHTGLEMLMRHYYREDPEAMLRAVEQATWKP